MSTASQRDYHAEYLRRKPVKRDREKYLAYQREYGRKMRALLKAAKAREQYKRDWIARRNRQLVVIASLVAQVDRWEYARRCAVVREELRAERS